MTTVISVENLSKSYRLGQIGTGTFAHDLNVWWARRRSKSNPMLRIGETDHGNRDGEELWALRDVSFTVEQGEVLGIIGRNGAGKSTLLKILSRVTAPTSGVIKVKGRVASLLEVGTGFHPDLTGRENIYLNGAILGMNRSEIDRKFDEIVDFSGVKKFIDTPVKRYSSGMYVRLAFAVAAHLEPEILVVDEVLAVGDETFQKKCLGKMGEVAGEGRTVLFVSHNMGMIRELCPKTLLFINGHLEKIGATDDVVNHYLNSHSKNLGGNNDLAAVDCESLDHSGTGEARITWAEIRNSKAEKTVNIYMNEEFQIIFGIKNPYNFALTYAIEVVDKHDYPLVHLWSEYEDTVGENDQELQKVRVTLPAFNLYPDNYFIHLWVGVHARRMDKVEKVFKIHILKDPNIKQGLLTTRGRYYHRGKWEILICK